MRNTAEALLASLKTAFIDKNHAGSMEFRPQFLSNNYQEGRKVLASIEDELCRCEAFCISVAFITVSGITPLLQTFKELEQKGIPGQILTTDYLYFSEPKALSMLNQLNNIELKMYHCSEATDGFHTKGYIFKQEEIYHMIVGSSNLTLNALTKNKEWNTRIVSTGQGEYAQEMLMEFASLWNSDCSDTYDEFIDAYQQAYQLHKQARNSQAKSMEKNKNGKRQLLAPNKMQLAFIQRYRELMDSGEKKALLISATGTGKTYASAFALKTYQPEKILFLVHREQIAKQAIKSYQTIFGDSKKFGLLSGTSKEYDGQYLFSTMQMMAKKEVRERYRPTEFDTIIIDEVHRAGSDSYQSIMTYFQPKFWLGMTASPERTDGYDIFQLFDHNIAYEIRLQQALEENLLCPFHYFGITDIEINGKTFDDQSGLRQFDLLVSDARVEYVMEKALYYGYSGDRVKGLIFCSSKQEGKELSLQFNKRGLKTLFLDGSATPEKREDSIDRLVNDQRQDRLDYILTIDIFNEGVDIPEVNQVIMLRPTESPIVFVQQLGRGLRKAEHKEFVVILDFIGNYTNNYLIPVALSGDRSYNKDNMRKYISEGTRIIPGSSSIHFDEISRQRIFRSIDQAKTNSMQLILESYRHLKYKIGKIPKIQDFADYGEIDVYKIIQKKGSYYQFLVEYEKDYKTRLTLAEAKVIEFVSLKMARGKRVHELCLLKCLIGNPQQDVWPIFERHMMDDYGIRLTALEKRSVYNQLTNQFAKEADRKKYQDCYFMEENAKGQLYISTTFRQMLADQAFVEILNEILAYGENQYQQHYAERYQETNFVLYQKYTYEDVCLLFNWKKNANAQNLGGYFYDKETKTLPVFINYDKEEDAIQYEDRFLSPYELIALSKQNRKVTSSDADHFYKRTVEDKNNRIYLFVRKNKDDQEAKEFYFLGEMNAIGEPEAIKKDGIDLFEVHYVLESPVREDIYYYLNETLLE